MANFEIYPADTEKNGAQYMLRFVGIFGVAVVKYFKNIESAEYYCRAIGRKDLIGRIEPIDAI